MVYAYAHGPEAVDSEGTLKPPGACDLCRWPSRIGKVCA